MAIDRQAYEKRRADRRAARCRHFTGIRLDGPGSGSCKLGIDYDSVKNGKPYGLACTSPEARPCCDKWEGRTPEELDAEDARFELVLQNTATARVAIVEHTGGKRGVSGAIDCPVCGNSECLRFSVAGSNGHIHAQCQTDGCVSWME